MVPQGTPFAESRMSRRGSKYCCSDTSLPRNLATRQVAQAMGRKAVVKTRCRSWTKHCKRNGRWSLLFSAIKRKSCALTSMPRGDPRRWCARVTPRAAPSADPDHVRKTLASFPSVSGAGPSGLRPSHVREAMRPATSDLLLRLQVRQFVRGASTMDTLVSRTRTSRRSFPPCTSGLSFGPSDFLGCSWSGFASFKLLGAAVGPFFLVRVPSRRTSGQAQGFARSLTLRVLSVCSGQAQGGARSLYSCSECAGRFRCFIVCQHAW